MAEQMGDNVAAQLAVIGETRMLPVSSLLMDKGLVAPDLMLDAMARAANGRVSLERVLVADALATPQDILAAQARHWGVTCVDPRTMAPDPDLAGMLEPGFCLANAVLPWVRIGQATVIATSRPDRFQDMRQRLPRSFGPAVMALALETDIQAIIAARHGAQMVTAAETCVPDDASCRDINLLTPRRAVSASAFAALCLMALYAAPQVFFSAVVALAVLSLLTAQCVKVAAFLASRRVVPLPAAPNTSNPMVSLLVPLFHEQNIAASLIARLERLTYPKALLDVVLILEAEDAQTRAALERCARPAWMRVIEVPKGSLTTKPRAMNYALNFCHGDIIGIYDAEDAPAANQISQVVNRFALAPARVACLQGILDFYNPRANWLSRCFAIEYATWFRILLPGIARLGFAVPLGGTTVFFRREALVSVRGWDAHNVTEDADLGIRLARHGYVTELLPTVTREEANNRVWPWIKQRSRWLKGYMITYVVHMRRPFRLLRDLGAWKFFGFQVFFLSAILQFLLAPALWSFWLVVLGLPHPMRDVLDPAQMALLIGMFLASEAVSLIVSVAAVARSPHDGLLVWVPTMALYFPLGAIAAYKALYELVARPFYWDKTSHGHSQPDHAGADRPAA